MLRRNVRQVIAWLSLVVVLSVFWVLKLTGVTLAGEAFCGQNEHMHGEACFTGVLVCMQEEEAAHFHGESCLVRRLICNKETADHGREDSVYHVSEDSQVIFLAEHTHTDDCWHIGAGFGCGLTEAAGHIHTDACLTEQTELGCGRQATPGHVHTDACYEKKKVCPLEEHVHVETCYCNLSADLETADDWEMSLAGLSRGTTTAANVVIVAQSQMGYQESTLNFELDEDLVRRGITRYGQWYGNPYGDWSAMFASFCLHYAGVEDAPANAGPESMRLEWAAEDMYRSASEFAPRVGDVIFLRTAAEEDDGEEPAPAVMTFRATRAAEPAADTVALIKEITEDSVTVIQGDVDGQVAEVTYPIEDAAILGYGLVPEVSAYAALVDPTAETSYLANTISYNADMFTAGRSFVLYTVSGGQYYAFDGGGKAVPVYIDSNGEIRTESGDRDSLLWEFTKSGTGYVIRNRGTGRHIHPYYNSSSDYGVTTSGGWETQLVRSGSGVLLRASAYARLSADGQSFVMTRSQSEASIFQFGMVEYRTVWLDGTNGDLMSLRGSDKTSYSLLSGDQLTLPTEWRTPGKYSYTLKGWYDVKNGRYYAPGDTVTVTEDLLFYADWIASTYDIGQLNTYTVDTVSTSEFITTHVFDYNALFNTLSQNNSYTGGDSAVWTLVENGAVVPSGEETLNFIFVDYDASGDITYPHNRNQANGVDYTVVTPGLYNEHLAELLFDRDVEVVGKHYLGTGDHLFQYGADPTDTEHFGYYYYDSMLNAASYNQSRRRFYVYDYLERTVDSAGNNSYSDFLPLNSPYANTNGNALGSYTYPGESGEYVGVSHVAYDTKYSDSNNSPSRVMTNFFFGMATEMEFYLPAVPGTFDSDGHRANQSITGEDMVFEFAGDDDVWVLIDGELVLDIGGIHGVEAGYIDFSTGKVVVDGRQTGTVTHLEPGSHTLTMYYLERGSSMSNFKLRFNLSPRYSMTLRKEDTLTAHLLNGAEFSVYTDAACTRPAQLWTSKEAHGNGEASTNRFTVEDGVSTMWGFAAGSTYYIVETRGPDVLDGEPVNGIIRMHLNNQGSPDYEVLPDAEGNLTVGFMVHGFKVSEDKQEAYLVISNTDATESQPTEVYVEKVWADHVDHTADAVTVYLLANGTQIQNVSLNADNSWRHMWENLPSTDADGDPVRYTVREATVPGYLASVESITASSSGGSSGSGDVTVVTAFEDGETYLLQTKYGYLGANGDKLLLLNSEAEALNSAAARWNAELHSDGTLTLVNEAGQTLYYDNYTFRASSSPGTHKNLRFSGGLLYWFYDYGSWQETLYPIDGDNTVSNIEYNGVFYTTNTGTQAVTFAPCRVDDGGTAPEPEPPVSGGSAYRITNMPAGEAVVSLTVRKAWELGNLGHESMYAGLTVQMKLLADGEDAGLTGSLSQRSGWQYTFTGLPKYDSGGDEIVYTVEEIPFSDDWTVTYGPVIAVSELSYETTVTNSYHMTAHLPETVGIGPYVYTIPGVLIMLGTLGCYRGQRRRSGRRGR